MRRSPTCRLVSLNVPEASTATYASNPLPTAVIAGKAAQTSSEMPAKISFLRPVASIARATRASSNALTDERSMISMPGSASTSSGNVGPHMLSRAVVVYNNRQFQCFCSSGQGHDVMFQLAGRIVTDARHEADLMIDEDERRVLGSQGFVRSGLI